MKMCKFRLMMNELVCFGDKLASFMDEIGDMESLLNNNIVEIEILSTCLRKTVCNICEVL
jgi:hypothetical protein